MNCEDQILISSMTNCPTILRGHHDGQGIVLYQGKNRVLLDGDELHRLLQAIDRPPTVTSPSHARMLVYPADE